MAYVGNQPARGQFRKLTDISGSFNGVTTTFTTSVPPGTTSYYVTAGTASQLLVSLGGVIQQPEVDYTVSTNSITFTTAPAAGLSFFGVLMGDALNSGTPGDGTVTTTKLAGNLNVGLAGGSAASPSLYFTGDTNNGIYSPGADTLAISTNGSQRVTVNSSGNVGIATATPDERLAVNGAIRVTSNATQFSASDGGVIDYNAGNTRIVAARSTAADGAIQFFTTSSGTIAEKARLDGSGRLLVGTSTAQGNPLLQIQGNAGASNDAADMLLWRNNAPYGFISGTIGTRLQFGASPTSGVFGVGAIIQFEGDGTWSSGNYPGRLVLSTTASGASSPTERLRIDNRGRVNVGGTGGLNAGFTVDWPANALEPVVINDTSNTAGQTHRISFRTGGTETGKIISGTTLGTSYVTSSDYRLKQGIVDLGDGVGRLAQLKPRRFSFINSPETVIDGFVAHEVQDIVPEAITGEKDAVDDDGNPIYQGIDHSRLVPLLTAALQEAIAKIESLEARLSALEAA